MNDKVDAELQKLRSLEDDAEMACISGTVAGKELSATGLVDMMKLRYRIVATRAMLLGILPAAWDDRQTQEL